MNKVLLPCLLFFSLVSCSTINNRNLESSLINSDDLYHYTDKAGQFEVHQNVGYEKEKRVYVTKRILIAPKGKKENALEQSVTLSNLGSLNKTLVLRPRISQYNVWFDKKKYFSEIKFNAENRSVDLRLRSPESQWNGNREIKFPNSKSLPCFFNQIIECAKVTGFVQNSKKQKRGKANFLIIWEGYPYLQETLSDFPNEIFSEAVLEYDGAMKNNETRYTLSVAGQTISYFLNKNDAVVKIFWVNQGISQVEKSIKATMPDEENF